MSWIGRLITAIKKLWRMAKGNLFQGMGRGALGDITLQRKNGEQQTSVRVRRQNNPQSDAQCINRTIMMTVGKMYSEGKFILDHAFEGATTPADNQSRFYRANLGRLKSTLYETELDVVNYYSMKACFNAPGMNYLVPNKYVISEGSLPWPSDVFRWENGEPWNLQIQSKYAKSSMPLGEWLEIWPYDSDDLFSIVMVVLENPAEPLGEVSTEGMPASNWYANKIYPGHFMYFRFRLRESFDQPMTTPLYQLTWTDLFTIETNSPFYDGSEGPSTHKFYYGMRMSFLNEWHSNIGSMGLIYSRENEGLRSASEMNFYPGATPLPNTRYGISGGFILRSWAPYRQ